MSVLDWLLIIFLVVVFIGGSVWFLRIAYNDENKNDTNGESKQ